MNANECKRIFNICFIKDSIVVQTSLKLQKVDRANFERWLHLEEFLMHIQLSKKFDPLMSKQNIVHNGIKGKIGNFSFQLKQVNGVSHIN